MTGPELHIDGRARTSAIGGLSVVIAMIAYSAFALYRSGDPGELGSVFLASVVAYGLAIYLYFGIATLVWHRQSQLLIAGSLAAVAVGVYVGGIGSSVEVLLLLGSVFATGYVHGRMISSGQSGLKTYVICLGALTAFAIAEFGPKWPELMRLAGETGKTLVNDFEMNMKASNYSPDAVQTYRGAFEEAVSAVVRLLPAAGILSAFTQFSIGFLWFSGVVVRGERGSSGVRPFAEWRVPFAVTPLILVAVGARLLGGESVRLVADNVLIVLAVFYSVTGLALVEWVFKKISFPWAMRILFYVLLFFMQVVGFLMIVLLGFVDSFADWRSRAAAKISVDN